MPKRKGTAKPKKKASHTLYGKPVGARYEGGYYSPKPGYKLSEYMKSENKRTREIHREVRKTFLKGSKK